MKSREILTALLICAVSSASFIAPRPVTAASSAVAVLVYHNFITDEVARTHPKQLDEMTMSLSQFAAQLDLLKDFGAHVLTPTEFLQHVRGEVIAPPRSVLIMIDDGYASNYTLAWPLLKERGLPAVVGIITLATDDPGRWHTFYPNASPHLTWAQIAEMTQPVKVGSVTRPLIYIGSHTYNRHVNLRKLENSLPKTELTRFYDELLTDLVKARQIITAKTGAASAAELLVWPHGGFSDRMIEVARRAGHLATFADLGEAVRPRGDPMRISRIHAGSGIRSVSAFQRSLHEAGWGVARPR
jgi:peptidoglycan/xylan/chitin deacetylase (PgdA/CDA1 family)